MTELDPEANETLSEEFRRLISEYHDAADGDPTKEEEAWNLIADFSVANCEAIFDGLSALYAEAQAASAERIADLERQLAEEQHRHMITEKDACAQAEMRSESERRREAAEKMLAEADVITAKMLSAGLMAWLDFNMPKGLAWHDDASIAIYNAMRHAARAEEPRYETSFNAMMTTPPITRDDVAPHSAVLPPSPAPLPATEDINELVARIEAKYGPFTLIVHDPNGWRVTQIVGAADNGHVLTTGEVVTFAAPDLLSALRAAGQRE